jgi:hypothetical protein
MTTLLRRPRHGAVKQRCFDEYFEAGVEVVVRLGVEQGVEQGVKEASVRRWIYDWAAARIGEHRVEQR